MSERDKNTREIKEVEGPRHLWITLMGAPASGKTTLGERLAERIGSEFIFETPVGDIQDFEKYNLNPEKYALITQLLFIQEAYYTIKGFESEKKVGVSEILKTKSLITEPLFNQNALYAGARMKNLPKERKIYLDYFQGLFNSDSFPKPDIVFYLRMTPELFFERLKLRAEKDPTRKSELESSPAYWNTLLKLMDWWERKNRDNFLIQTINLERFGPRLYSKEEDSIDAVVREMMLWFNYHSQTFPKFGKNIIPETIKNFRMVNNRTDDIPFNSLNRTK